MQPTASGSKFSVIVYNQFSSATSHVAILNVTTRTNPPVVLAAVSVDGASVTLLWNEPVDPTTAGNKANYSIGGGVTVSDATVSASGLSVTLATSALTISNIYTVTLNGILNGSTRAVPVAPGTTVSFVAQT